MTVISPWSCGGWVNSEVFDHTSVIRFMEKRFGVEAPEISAYRRAITGDLTSCFDFSRHSDSPVIHAPDLDRAQADALTSEQAARAYIPVPSVAEQSMPDQLNGVLPSRALPYALHVDATVDADRGTVSLTFRNIDSRAAVFQVCDKHRLDQIPRRYTVGAGRQLEGDWSIADADKGHYDLWVLGPNGFHRAFAGRVSTDRPLPSPEIRISYDIANNRVIARLENTGGVACEFSAKANAYVSPVPSTTTVAPNERAVMEWAVGDYGNWYDLTINVPALAGFHRRFAGRIENGRDLTSDPAMGMPRT
jgi:phospholipase C